MKAKLSKVLALLLACVMIFTTLPLMAFASDEAANIYTVSNESPAIPMTVGTQIAVGDLAVTFSDGTVVAGDALTWISTGSGVSVKNGYLVAKEVGPVKLTVTATDGKSRNIYAAVASAEDAAKGLYKFYTYDFANGMGDEWVVDTTYTGAEQKLGLITNEQGQLVASGKTPSARSYSKTKINATTGNFEYNTFDTTTKYQRTVWWDYDYFNAGIFANDMGGAFQAGIISNSVYSKVKELGAYIPFVNTNASSTVTYYDADGVATTGTGTTQATSYMYTKNAIFNDFTNYTTGAKMLTSCDNYGGFIALLGRVSHGTLHIHEYMGLAFNTNLKSTTTTVNYRRALASTNGTIWLDYYYGQQARDTGFTTSALKSADTTIEGGSEFVEVTTKFHGNQLSYAIGEEKGTFTEADANYQPEVKTGGIGIMAQYSYVALKEMYAAINSEYLVTLPNAVETKTEIYTVSYGSPAIPMNENTAVDLSLLNVEMDADGTVVSGADITWKAQKQEGLYLNNAGKKVSVYAAGNYKLTATYNGVSKNVWVIAKKAQDTDFALIDYNFADGYNPADWQFVLWKNTTDPNVGYDADPTVSVGALEYSSKNGYVAMGLNKGVEGTFRYCNYGVLINKNPIFDDFADYTVTSLSSTRAGGVINGWGGPGIMGRVQLTADGAIDNSNNAIIAEFLGLGSVRVAANTTTWWLSQKYTCDDSYIRENKGTLKKDMEGYNGHYYWTNTTTLDEYKILKGVYDGENFALSVDSTEIYNLSKASDADKTAWAKDVNHAVGAGAPGIFVWGGKIQMKTFKVTLNSNDMPEALAAEEEPPVVRYVVESFDPVIVMYNNTSVLLDNIAVQFEDGGKTTVATDVEWTVPETDGIEIIGGEEGKIIAHTNGTYVVTATSNGVSKKIYLLVTDKSKDEIVLFSDDFSEGELNYNIWQQTEYYWGEPVQVTAQKDKSDKYIEGINIAQLGAIPFVTRDYWDALYLGGPRSHADAGGTGYKWQNVFMNNTQYYMYIREDYVTEDGIKISDLGVYDVSTSFTTLNQGTNICKYNAATDTYGDINLLYNGFGVMGRINFAGESFYNKSKSSMQSFKWDYDTSGGGKTITINGGAGASSTAVQTGSGAVLGTGSMRVSYRANEINGKYIPIGNTGTSSNTANFVNASYSTTAKGTTGIAGSVGFFTEAHDIDIFDFTVSYPVMVPEYEDIKVTVENNTITVPVNTTIDLSKYTFMVDGVATKGNQVAWSGLRNEIGEIDSVNGTFTAFSVGTATVNGVTFVVSDTKATVGAKALVNINGNGSVSVAPNGTSNSYAVQTTADSGYLLKGGVVTVAYADGTTKTVGVDDTGKAIITADHIGGISIDVEFVAKREVGFVSLGATIRLPGTKDAAGNTLKHGIKFGARINNIRLYSGKPILDGEVTLAGNDYKVAEVGSLVIPTQLLFGSELTVNSERAQRKKVSVVSNATENFADITTVLVGIPENWYGIDISFRGYIKLTNLDGTEEFYVYTDEIERSYNGVMKAAPVTATGVEFNADNTTIMLTSAKPNLKYALGEEMIIIADTYVDGTMANGISLAYKVFKGDANGYSGSAIATGTAKSSGTASVKISYTTAEAGYYYVVVSALDKDGNTVIADTIRLGAGLVSTNGTKVFDENNIALNFGIASDTHIMGEYMNYRSNRHLIAMLKVLNNQAGYYADGTQKLDALLVAGDLTNAVIGSTNLNGLPGWKSADTVAKFDYLIYSEVNAFRNIMNNYLGDTQLIYSLGNHDTAGGKGASFKYASYMFRPTLYYQQILSGKRVELPAAVADMTPEQISAVHFNVNDDYTDSKDYIKYYGRDEESAQDFNEGNRIMHINGYTFVAIDAMVLQNGFARYTDSTLRFLKDALDESVAKDPSAPVFIITHYRPYGTEAYQVDLPYNGARNIDELLQNYPQAVLWGGHKHVPLQTETSIIQTRTVDENGNVIESGYTSLTSAASAYGSADKFGDPNNQEEGSYTQLVQVDINGNIKITRYYISSDTAGQACETTSANEVVKGSDGQWIKSWTDNSAEVVIKVKTINNPWFIINSVDDNVRDEYAPDVRAALSQPEFVSNNVTVNGKTITFPKAVNALGVNNAETMIVQYRAYLYDADGNLVEQKDISRFINRYANYYDVPDPDTYSVTFSGEGTRVVIRAFDTWACFFDHESRYPSLVVDLT